MKLYTQILPFVAVTTAFVVPDQQLLNQIVLETKVEHPNVHKLPSAQDIFSQAEETFHDAVAYGENALDNAFNAATEKAANVKNAFQCFGSMTAFDTQAWLDTEMTTVEDVEVSASSLDLEKLSHKHGHKGHKGKPNKTVYELIASSKYTTKLAELINEYDDLVEVLNGTAANYTVFAPTNKAFEKIPKGHGKPSKELLKKVLSYHVSPDFYPAGRVLVSHTIPTAVGEDALGGPQRLRVGLSLRGLTVNFYSRIVAINIFGTNGVIHGVDSLLLPPPKALKIIDLLPSEFSTLQLALLKTGLGEVIATSEHVGGTLFAPSNSAFSRLGPKINAFLFSKYGEKYLKALLKYHVVSNQTLYSDAFYRGKKTTGFHVGTGEIAELEEEVAGIPKGRYHVDLPTLLEDKSLSIDVARYGGFISIRINGFSTISVQDGIAKDGVIHVLSSVLIPPHKPGGGKDDVFYQGEEMDVEDFKQRLEPYAEDVEEL